jgi:hypothetical protein
MKHFPQLIIEQKTEVLELKKILQQILEEKIYCNTQIKGALLTGSVARGDARVEPYGIMIDLILIVKRKEDISLEKIFGKDEEPYIPYHCVSITDKVGLAIEIIEEKNLYEIRNQPESVIFSKNESIIIYDKESILIKWKNECFKISEEQVKSRALNSYFRFSYLTGEYRLEKWMYREALVQVEQNFHEASECYCNFLYCINGYFIPRKDWLTYLTYELNEKPENHNHFLQSLYTSSLDNESISRKNIIIQEIENWMKQYCKLKNWL